MAPNAESIDDKLTGMSLGERHKALNSLVDKADRELLSEENLRNWSQKSQADQIFIARLADHFKDAPVLCKLFQSENQMVVSIALHSRWFFKGTSHKDLANADYFIQNIFPNASYHTICRLVVAFGSNLRDERVAEDFYEKMLVRYGPKMALKLLPACRVEFIRSKIIEEFLLVPCAQLKNIYKKDKQLVVEYLEKCLGKKGIDKLPASFKMRENYNDLWNSVAQDDPDSFLRLFDKFPESIKTRLGAKSSQSILKIILDKVIEKPSQYLSVLHQPTLLVNLKGPKLEQFLLNIMPKNFKEFSYHDVSQYLTGVKPAYRAKLLIKIYSDKYNGASVLDTNLFTISDLAEYLPVEERSSWARKKIENLKATDYYTEDYFLKYLPPGEGVPRLKTLSYSASDMTKRSNLLERMVDCCKINNDPDYLLEVMKYVAKRHRNDQAELRQGFLRYVSSSFTLYKLSADHWEIIKEMLDFMCISEEIQSYRCLRLYKSIMEEYIHYCCIHGIEVESSIDKLITYSKDDVDLLQDFPEYESKVLDIFFAKYKEMIQKDPEGTDTDVLVMALLETYSTRSDAKKHSVTECDWLMDVIKIKLARCKDEVYSFAYQITGALKDDIKTRKIFADDILKRQYDVKLATNYLKHDTDVMVRNKEMLMKNLLGSQNIKKNKRMCHKIRAYLKKPLGESLENSLKEIITKPETDDNTKQTVYRDQAVALVVYSMLSNIQESEGLIRNFAPTATSVDLNLHRAEYGRGEVLGNNMKFINPPVAYDTMLKFSQDDYLKFGLTSLLSLAFQKNTNDTEKFIAALTNKPVSVKKHSVRLAYFLFPQKDALNLFRGMWETEKNFSMREVLFKRTFQLMKFETDPNICRELWQTLKRYMESFAEGDINLFPYLTNASNITPNLVSDYCETCWKTLKALSQAKVDVSREIASHTQSFTNFIDLLSDEFCESIVTEYLRSIDNDSTNSDNLLMFLVDYLVKAKRVDLQNKHTTDTCNIFKKFTVENWNKKKDDDFKYRATLTEFVTRCCKRSLNSRVEVNPVNLLKSISDMVSSVLPFNAIFHIHIILNLTVTFKKLLDEPDFSEIPQDNSDVSPLSRQFIQTFGQRVNEHLNKLCAEYGFEIQTLFWKACDTFMSYVFDTCQKREAFELYFIAGLIGDKPTKQSFLMAIQLIPTSVPKDSVQAKLHQQLVDRILSEVDPVIYMTMNDKFQLQNELLH